MNTPDLLLSPEDDVFIFAKVDTFNLIKYTYNNYKKGIV